MKKPNNHTSVEQDLKRLKKVLEKQKKEILRVIKKKEFSFKYFIYNNHFTKGRLYEIDNIVAILENGLCNCNSENIILKGNVYYCKVCKGVVYG